MTARNNNLGRRCNLLIGYQEEPNETHDAFLSGRGPYFSWILYHVQTQL